MILYLQNGLKDKKHGNLMESEPETCSLRDSDGIKMIRVYKYEGR